MRKLLVVLLLLLGGLITYWFWSELTGPPELDKQLSSDHPATVSVQLFFGSSEKDPQSLHCDAVYPVARRIPQTSMPAHAALELLLDGPNQEEQARGYFTSIKPGVEVKSLSIDEGKARAEFNRALDEDVAGSCRVTAIRSQIESTLKQFKSVREVEILVEGRTETVLQP